MHALFPSCGIQILHDAKVSEKHLLLLEREGLNKEPPTLGGMFGRHVMGPG